MKEISPFPLGVKIGFPVSSTNNSKHVTIGIHYNLALYIYIQRKINLKVIPTSYDETLCITIRHYMYWSPRWPCYFWHETDRQGYHYWTDWGTKYYYYLQTDGRRCLYLKTDRQGYFYLQIADVQSIQTNKNICTWIWKETTTGWWTRIFGPTIWQTKQYLYKDTFIVGCSIKLLFFYC
jgi:hypothetical protein